MPPSLIPEPVSGPLSSPPTPSKAPLTMRSFGDSLNTRQRIYDQTLSAAQAIPPMVNDKYRLELSDVDWMDPDRFSRKDRKNAVLTGETLSRRLRGTWNLYDTAGKLLQKRRQVLGSVPYLSSMGTFTHRGNEYTLNHQQRLLPGVFAREKENGEAESHVNVRPGTGASHRYFLDPESGVFKLNLGQAEIPLMPLLQTLGATDKEIREAWGDQLHGANAQRNDAGAVKKIASKLLRKSDQGLDEGTTRERLIAAFHGMELDPEVTKRTLGHPYTRADKHLILAATKKLLALTRNEAEPDDRDHLAYQTLLGPEDLFSERIRKDHGGIRRGVFKKITHKGSLDAMPSGLLTPQLEHVLLSSGLGENLEEVNPLEIFDKQTKLTRMGEGGIGSTTAIPSEARSVQPSHVGYVDLVRTPECYDEETEVMTKAGWRYWRDVKSSDAFACLIDGRLEFHNPEKLIATQYSGDMYGAKTEFIDYLVTPNHRMFVQRDYRASAAWRTELATKTHERSCRYFMCGGHLPFIGLDPDVLLPAIVPALNKKQETRVTNACDWGELIGWMLSEGDTNIDYLRSSYRTRISQSLEKNSENHWQIAKLLSRLPFAYSENENGFVISGKQLAIYSRQFGYCYDKFIPADLLFAPEAVRRRLFESLLRGDGRKAVKGAQAGKITQFCTSSRKLAQDFESLAFGLGYSVRTVFEPDERQERYLGCYVTHIHMRSRRTVIHRSPWTGERYHYKKSYTGKVYCATVPGGLLYVRRKGSVGMWCGNSEKSGVDLYLSKNTQKGSDGRLYTKLRDRTGNMVWKSPQDVADATIATADVFRQPTRNVSVMQGGKIVYRPKTAIDYVIPQFETAAFSPLANLIPFKSTNKPHRMAMGARYYTQALPLIGAQAPLVQGLNPDDPEGRSFEEEFGRHAGAVRADQGGRVLDLQDGVMKIQYDDGKTEDVELYQNHPFNRRTRIHQEPTVQPGQPFRKGQLLARSNYTDDKGTVALGTNLRTAYFPYKGFNFEDAIVISESAAKDKLRSEHMYQHELSVTDKHKVGRNAFINLFPAKYDKSTLETLDDDGVIKPGQKVEYGQPLILAAKERDRSHNKIHKKRQPGYADESVVWEHHDPGVVTDVVWGRNGPVVSVKSESAMQIGDKLSGRIGDKGVVAHIAADRDMPHDESGQPFEILLSPDGTITRTNQFQNIEAALGRIAAKTGQPIKLRDFDTIDDASAWAEQQLAAHGMKPTETVTWNGKKIPGIGTGVRFFMKLHHMAEHKAQGRSSGAYSSDEAPSKGGPTGAKRISLLDVNSLLSHGAVENLKDATTVRGQSNPEWWMQFMSGYNPHAPRVPMVYRKFVNQLKGAGINVVPDGPRTQLMAMTNKDVQELAGDRLIQSGETVHFDKGLKPIPGGLFDEKLTGGHAGQKWSAIQLPEPFPSPVMEEPIRRILGLTQKQFEATLAGDHTLDGHGTGPQGIAKALDDINLPKELAATRAQVSMSRGSNRDVAIRKLSYLKSAERLGLHPRDWMLDRVPVLPPAFRPVSLMADSNVPLVADANYLYRELLDATKNHSQAEKELGHEGIGPERLAIYHAFKAVTGLGDPVHPKLQEKGVKGLLKSVFGSAPKFGSVQRRLISSTVDNVGRAVASPNPDFDIDTVGLPEDKAFDVYEKFIVRRLRRRGLPIREALRHVKDRTPLARETLSEEMDNRPVLVNRAPVLHKFGIMAFRPKIVTGSTIQVSPLIVKGPNLDFDGDALQFHVPTTDKAVEEAYDRMLPSRNLLSPADFSTPMHVPGQQYMAGLFQATSKPDSKKRPRVFATKADALAAYRRGDISADTAVQVVRDS